MQQRVRITILLAVAAFALCAQTSQGGDPPPLYLTFDASGSLDVSLAGGAAVGSSTTILPGPYWVTFTNEFPAERDIVHKWHIFGPGIDIWTDLNCSDSTIEQYLETLRPSSTYTVQDDYHPTNLHVVFRTSATGSSTSGPGSASSPGSKPGSTVTNSDVVGSGLLPYRGSLAALVSAAGKLSLTRDGKRVTSLKAGRYTITVVDRSVKAGFTLKKVTRGPLPLTSAVFVGRRSARLQLGAGPWTFFSGSGRPTRFSVVAGG